MKFKDEAFEMQLENSPPLLLKIAKRFDEIASGFGKGLIITRVWNSVPGDSGVHEAHRAFDGRDQVATSLYVFTLAEAEEICHTLNSEFPRHDGKQTILHHRAHDDPKQMLHFHVQIPA